MLKLGTVDFPTAAYQTEFPQPPRPGVSYLNPSGRGAAVLIGRHNRHVGHRYLIDIPITLLLHPDRQSWRSSFSKLMTSGLFFSGCNTRVWKSCRIHIPSTRTGAVENQTRLRRIAVIFTDAGAFQRGNLPK
jgi:hypothetical protein